MNDSPKSRFRDRGWVKARPGFIAMLLLLAGAATGRTAADHITPNFKDADFTALVEAVSAATGKNFIVHPRVRARVTMVSSTEMSATAFYDAFLSLLPACGFVAVPDRDVVSIIPDTRAPRLIPASLPGLTSVSCVPR